MQSSGLKKNIVSNGMDGVYPVSDLSQVYKELNGKTFSDNSKPNRKRPKARRTSKKHIDSDVSKQ